MNLSMIGHLSSSADQEAQANLFEYCIGGVDIRGGADIASTKLPGKVGKKAQIDI